MVKVNEMPTQEELNRLFKYDPETGLVTRKVTVSPMAKAGDIVGTLESNGYLRVRIKYLRFYLHRVVWAIINGDLENALVIDHVDRNRLNNKLDNLRLVTRTQNGQNKKKSSANTSGFKGVIPVNGKYRAMIKEDGKRIHLGYFNTAKEAAETYDYYISSRPNSFYSTNKSLGLL